MGTEKLDTRLRQEQIAKAALDLVSERGLSGMSVAAVARRVGLVPSAIYRHFKSKEEMLDAAIGLIRRRLLDNVEASCAANGYSVECLRNLLMCHVELIRENRGIPRIVFSEDVLQGAPHRRKTMYGVVREYLDRVAEIVERSQKRGQIKAHLDPQTVAMSFLGMIQPAVLLWHMSDGKYDVTRHAQSAWRVFCETILMPKRPSRGQAGPRPRAKKGAEE